MEIERSLEILNKYGLHARASTRLAQVAGKYRSRILLSLDNGNDSPSQEVDAKSVLGILSLGVERGVKLRVRIDGDDAEAAMAAVADLVNRKFEEE